MPWPFRSPNPSILRILSRAGTDTHALAAKDPWRRPATTALHFYQNKQLELYASKQANRLTLRQLVFFGRSMNEDRLIKSANYVRTELPVRIAHRIRDLQALPYVVVTEEGVAKVYELYWTAFDKFRRYPVVTTLEENKAFCDFVQNLLTEHRTVIPSLSLGLSLSSPNLAPDTMDAFVHRMLVSRISRRVLAQHHLALSEDFNNKALESRDRAERVGIIYTALRPKDSIEKCIQLIQQWSSRSPDLKELLVRGTLPNITIEGHLDTTFAYIREHFEYIIFELLKNATRAVLLRHGGISPPEIRVTVVAGVDNVSIRISDQGGGLHKSGINAPSDLFSFSHLRNGTRMTDDRLGALRNASALGLSATLAEQVDSWARTHDMDEAPSEKARPIPSIGIGLPMSNMFATYFGGSLELVSLAGWGTDVYLRLPKLGTNLEEIAL